MIGRCTCHYVICSSSQIGVQPVDRTGGDSNLSEKRRALLSSISAMDPTACRKTQRKQAFSSEETELLIH